jgi:imidazolonepropionase-like amidohydrolase
MKQYDVVLDATVSTYENYKNSEKTLWIYEMVKRITRNANKSGVKVAAGSDSHQETFVQHEMKLLVNVSDFTPFEAIIAATKHAAQATGILEMEGTIDVGKKANLLF